MLVTPDARSLSSGTPQEELYADYANIMKSLAAQARLEYANTGKIEYSASANKAYAEEVDSILAKLNIAEKNAPYERKAQRIANMNLRALRQENPDIATKEKRKLGQQALTAAREQIGARKKPIHLTDKEWRAIQAGAISSTKLEDVLKNMKADHIKELATPRAYNAVSLAKEGKIQAMRNSGYTLDQIATACSLSTTTVSKYIQS